MRKRRLSKKLQQKLREWTHVVSCKPCSEHFTWHGKNKPGTQYTCKGCGKLMSVENRRNSDVESRP